LSGDFNIDFSTEKSEPLIDFLKTALDLNMSNDLKESTTKYGTRNEWKSKNKNLTLIPFIILSSTVQIVSTLKPHKYLLTISLF
jgi:hypothetical protein